ncbi:MAG: alpha/beta hydrolase [Dehalococcoidia bacterium]|nr:alpha/beta hydrolase [Dehalococcoidia bacterium]
MPKIAINGASIFYQDDDFSDPWGPRKTVVIQHGFCRNSNFFRAWVPWLARRYRVVRTDLRGCGQSDDPGPAYRYSMDGLIDDLTGLLDALGIASVHYIGEGLGGMIGAAAACRLPERFDSLTLVCTPVTVSAQTRRLQTNIQDLGMYQWWLHSRGLTQDLSGDPAQDHYFAGEFARTPVHIAAALSSFVPTFNLAESLHQIKAPALVMSPGASAQLPQDEQASLKAIPGVRWRTYEKLTGSMPFYAPDRLAKDALDFIMHTDGAGAGDMAAPPL